MNNLVAYFAGSFNRKPELLEYLREFEAAGNYCTSRWLKNDHELDFQDDRSKLNYSGFGFTYALEDVDDIVKSECIIFFSSANHPSKGRGGRHTEFGIGLALGRPIFIIGERECAFHSMTRDELCFKDWDDFKSSDYPMGVVTRYRDSRRPYQFNG